ncbi:hypothetical protein ASPFODRAFT_213090 [Aspergillus luchuensis CBS 106.47]|uniref:Uncharacterized protein n=1 Tax=Aspergillus luchuensis (strain CBS 106.47) TaxID=1137211 RepID=A0A1M3SZ25_ASPLC|nr:hypothetical protein ASPFODRAFT_213090 [Aspergillus luchuensis CBS 106.47]
MDEQHPLPLLEYKYSVGLRNELGTSERLSGLAISGEGSVSAAAPFRQHHEDTNATEPVEDHRKTLEARTKCSHTSPCEACRKARSACVPQSDRPRANHRTTISTETRTEKSPVSRIYADQPSSNTSRTYEAHASASMEEHRWNVSDMGCASDVAILRDSGAERGSTITCPADVTARGDWNVIRDDGNSTLRSDIGDNAGWGPPPNATALPSSLMPANNSTGNPTAHAWYSMPWASEPYSWETLPASFWGWTWSQADNMTASETDGSLHSSIPAPQAAGWPFGDEAEQPQYPTRSGIMPFCGDDSQELYPPGPSFDAPDPIPSLALPAESPMLSPPWDPLALVSAALPMTDFHRRSLHQQPFAPIPVRNIESTVPPWLQIMMDYQGTEVSPFDNVGANRQEPSCNITVPEDQVERPHST